MEQIKYLEFLFGYICGVLSGLILLGIYFRQALKHYTEQVYKGYLEALNKLKGNKDE